ncbi:hypothetical protein ACQ86G_09195 [Roseateles chitinivorans]|uniref:hypothetical protein n=1 Tax=Roseateles chitinivorans TaxID=2917965 RepID=UPI003D677344
MDQDVRLYDAIVWTRNPESIGQRIAIWAVDGDDALRQLFGQFGEDIIYTLKNEEEASRIR